MNNVSLRAYDPYMFYKLDPGEWGSASPVPASQSLEKVASHEASNLIRFESEANRKGCYIIMSNIHIDFGKRGIFLAATSGRTTAWIYCPKREEYKQIKDFKLAQLEYKIKQYSNKIDELNKEIKKADNPYEKSLLEIKKDSLKSQKINMEMKKIRLYLQLNLLVIQGFAGGNLNVTV